MYISFAYDHHKLLFVFSTPCSEQRLGSDRTSQETWWLWLGKVSAHGIAGGGGAENPSPSDTAAASSCSSCCSPACSSQPPFPCLGPAAGAGKQTPGSHPA